MKFIIESGIEMPPVARGKGRPPGPLAQAIARMEVGDSVEIASKAAKQSFRVTAARAMPGAKFSQRGLRFWRVS